MRAPPSPGAPIVVCYCGPMFNEPQVGLASAAGLVGSPGRRVPETVGSGPPVMRPAGKGGSPPRWLPLPPYESERSRALGPQRIEPAVRYLFRRREQGGAHARTRKKGKSRVQENPSPLSDHLAVHDRPANCRTTSSESWNLWTNPSALSPTDISTTPCNCERSRTPGVGIWTLKPTNPCASCR